MVNTDLIVESQYASVIASTSGNNDVIMYTLYARVPTRKTPNDKREMKLFNTAIELIPLAT